MPRFYENKDRFIDKNSNLAPWEKEKFKKFFREHPEQESKIKNWSVNLSPNDFKQIIKSYNERLLPKNTINDLKEGVDYEKIYSSEEDGYDYYYIYTYKASVAFASNNIGLPIWGCEPDWYIGADEYESNVIRDYPEFCREDGRIFTGGAKWCISMNHTSYYWDYYTHENGKNLAFIFALYTRKDYDYNNNYYNKYALCINKSTLFAGRNKRRSSFEIYDGDDDYVETDPKCTDFLNVVNNNIDKLRECVNKTPQADFNKKFYTYAETESKRLYKQYKKAIPDLDEVIQVVSEFRDYPLGNLKAWMKSQGTTDLNEQIYYFNQTKEYFTYQMEKFYNFIESEYVRTAHNIKELKDIFFNINETYGIDDTDLLYTVIRPCQGLLTGRCREDVEKYFEDNKYFKEICAFKLWDYQDLYDTITRCNDYTEVYGREIFLTNLIRDNITTKEFEKIFVSHEVNFIEKPNYYYTTDDKHYFLVNDL